MSRLFQARLIFLLSLLSLLAAGCGDDSTPLTVFELKIENVSTADTLIASDGTSVRILFSPAVWTVHDLPPPIFTLGAAERGNGLEQFAEDADSSILLETLRNPDSNTSLVGLAQTTDGEQRALAPGDSYTFQVAAERGKRFSLVSGFLQGNDLFVGLNDAGIPLFNSEGVPLSGDITSEFFLYDTGTELNQEPGLGPDQVLRQAEPGAGTPENGAVAHVNDGFFYPSVGSMIRVTITPTQEVEFEL